MVERPVVLSPRRTYDRSCDLGQRQTPAAGDGRMTVAMETVARRSRSDGVRTREAILSAAMALATTEGLDRLTIGGLADHLDMSKSGVFAHFRSKEALQLATVA